jgi:hypothetical protein
MPINYESNDVSTSGIITANSGNFINSLQVNGTGVWHSGNFDSSNIVRTTGTQTIDGSKTFDSQPTFNYGISVGGSSRFSNGAGGGMDFSVDRGNVVEGFSGDVLKFDVDNDNGTGYSTTLKTYGPNKNIIIRLPSDSGVIARLTDITTTNITGTLAVNKGGTGRTSYSNGQLLIGSGTSLVANTLTTVSGIGIINGSGSITIGVTGIPSSSITNFNSGVSGLLPNIANSGNNRILTSDGSNIGINANSNLYFSGNNKNYLNLTSVTGVGNRPTLTIGGEGLSNLSGTPSASFFTKGRLIIAREDQTFVDIDAQYNTFSIDGSLNVDPNIAGTINCMFVNAGPSIGGSLSTDTLNIYQIIAHNIPTTNITLSDSVIISSDPGANITLYDSASISSNGGAYITLTDNIAMNCGGQISLTCDPAATIELNGPVNVNGDLTFDSYTESVVANGNSGASKTLSLASGTVHTCTLTGNCTFTMPTATAGKSFSVFLNTGSGNYTASFSGVRWADSAIPTATITASKVDIYSFISDGSFWYGSFSQNYG